MRRFGLIGRPLGHSASAKYFTEKFRKEGLSDCEYALYELPSVEELPSLLAAMPELCGLNVTIPYKRSVMHLLDRIAPEAQVIGAVNCIRRLPDGYQTMVGERGVTLSGGQKQRVAIARMLTKKTPIMVFDDSLSAVDTQTDEKIRTALGRDLAGTTTIIISHRITTLMDCDNVLVLEHGKLLQYGPPQTLLQADGLFRQIYDMQMSIGEEEGA